MAQLPDQMTVAINALMFRTEHWPELDGRAEAERAEAVRRAFALLAEHVGSQASAAIQAGGAYPVKSQQWDEVVYFVPRNPHERIKVAWRGSIVTESCLVTSEPSLPWPDVMLQRIRAIELDESVVFATGVVHDKRSHSMINQALRHFGLLPAARAEVDARHA